MNEINNQNMLQVGTILHGTYKIESYLASGGFGNTYLAKNIEFDETYAIKEFFVKGVCQRDGNSTTISVSNAENTNSFEQQREKFKKEARRLRSLSNPHIVKVYDLFEENGTAYYVMDYVDGENLSARLKRTNTPLAESEVRNYLNQILDGLEAIHNEGMFHLDIKPANIMVDSHNVVKLIDFGASKQQSTIGGATMSTGISYTNGYAPSEQMAQSYDKFGPWTDFYALGATMYKLLTNQDPPSVSDLSEDETEDKHLALPMPNVSGEMKKLVVWMMQENRLKRPKNVGEIRCILQQSSIATSNNEETKAFSPYQSYANPVNNDEETVWEISQVKVVVNEDRQGGDEKKNTSNHGLKIVSVILAVGITGLIMRAIYYGGSYDDAFERNMVHGLNTIDKFVSGGIIFLVFFVPIVSVVLYYVLKKYISWNSKFLLKDGR
ncbi:serine/threonine protein kinase [Segatella copri]|uniref:Serine/threonine protein kinase n=1 Tax=Segatella copri TaxID=165179 RepID=A0A3E5DYM3_9BACT|nr:serine/threonine-protein kinase [Segatella copri]RGN81603.1 serine/threonine protein kinase [Segatella copri]RGS12009.1 serine/threonine protein kinase [Segatella copri]